MPEEHIVKAVIAVSQCPWTLSHLAVVTCEIVSEGLDEVLRDGRKLLIEYVEYFRNTIVKSDVDFHRETWCDE